MRMEVVRQRLKRGKGARARVPESATAIFFSENVYLGPYPRGSWIWPRLFLAQTV